MATTNFVKNQTRISADWCNDVDEKIYQGIVATGATERRTLEDRASDVISVKDRGAVGDGVTDDTAAIQSALDSNKKVFFPNTSSNIYLCTDLRPNDYQEMYAAGGVELKQPDNSTSTGSGVITISGKTGVKVSGFIINGNYITNTYALRPAGWPWHGIVISSASSECRIEDCYIYDCVEPVNGTGDCTDIVIRAGSHRNVVTNCRLGRSNNNLMLYDTNYNRIDNLLIEDTELSEGISIFNASGDTDIDNHNVLTNIICVNARQSIHIQNSTGNSVSNFNITGCPDVPLAVRCGGNTVSNGYIQLTNATSGGANGIVLDQDVAGVEDPINISDVIVDVNGHDVAGNAVQIGGTPANINLTNVHLHNTNYGTPVDTFNGFHTDNAQGVRFMGCSVTNMAGVGIKIDSGCKDIQIIDTDAIHNKNEGLLVNANALYHGKVTGGIYKNNSFSSVGGYGINISDTGNHSIEIDESVQMYDDQDSPTQNVKGINVGGGSCNIVVSSSPPSRGFWRIGQRSRRRDPSGTVYGWYVFGRTDTTTTAIHSSGTNLAITSTVGMTAGDNLGVRLDTGLWHWTDIASVVDGTNLTLTDAIPSASASASRVMTTEWVAYQ